LFLLMEKVANRAASESEEDEFYRRQGPLMEYVLKGPAEELFEVKKVAGSLARLPLTLQVVRCHWCGEDVMEAGVRVKSGQFICAECYHV